MAEFINFIKAALATFILVLFVAFVLFFFTLGALRMWQEQNRDHIAPAWIKKAHKYHGIQSSFCERGECYFYRNGRRSKL